MLWASRLGVEGDYPEASLEQHQAADAVQQKIGTFKQSRSLPSTYLPLHRWGTGRGLVTPGVRTHLAWCDIPLPLFSSAKGTRAVALITARNAQLSARLRCAKCGGQLNSVKPWRVEEVLGKPLGRRGD